METNAEVPELPTEEEVEETDLQEVVEEVGSGKSDAVLGRGLLLEGEMGREIVIGTEAEHVADGESHVDIDPVLQDPIDGIVGENGKHTHHAKSY